MSIASNAAIRAVLAKAVTDAAFRTKCLSNPTAAAEELGMTLPAEVTFSETAGEGATILLPPLGADPDEIRDDLLLADVAGGTLDYKDPNLTLVFNGGPDCQTN